MKTYMGNAELIVVTDGLKYKVVSYETYDSRTYATINLELVAGWDYLDENSEIQGWCPADKFIEDVQYESTTWAFMSESMKEALEESGYKIVKG